MMNISCNGFYVTKGEAHKDWVGGNIETEKILYSYLKFNENGTFIKAIFDSPDFDFLAFISGKTKEELLKDNSLPYGDYTLKENDKVRLKYNLMNKWNMVFELEIVNAKLLKDQKGVFYYFKEI